jgi:hypothetical protein
MAATIPAMSLCIEPELIWQREVFVGDWRWQTA